MSLKDIIARDIHTVFLNTGDFCDDLIIQMGSTRVPVIGSLQENLISNNSGNGSPLQSVSHTLHIEYPIDDGENHYKLSSGQRITINDEAYTVTDIREVMGMAQVLLRKGSGR